MSKKAKKIVQSFYESDFIKNERLIEHFIHPELTLIWNSTTDGLSILNFDDLNDFFDEIKRNYADMRIEISHLLQDDNFVTIRYKYYITTLENPNEEMGIAHFIAIWEVKDDKLYKGYQISQPVTDKDDTQKSYHRVKV
ncbi:nuclear transport factor 2 family protein [uncultured Planktosalinus sp.]|uniref:nuclear transport factor 2 family protein n=1 Tax=uncultured Planktosalinus sp. TaxID=1810935 RepID=UPI0030DD936A